MSTVSSSAKSMASMLKRPAVEYRSRRRRRRRSLAPEDRAGATCGQGIGTLVIAGQNDGAGESHGSRRESRIDGEADRSRTPFVDVDVHSDATNIRRRRVPSRDQRQRRTPVEPALVAYQVGIDGDLRSNLERDSAIPVHDAHGAVMFDAADSNRPPTGMHTPRAHAVRQHRDAGHACVSIARATRSTATAT